MSNKSYNRMLRDPHIQLEGWVASVALHAVIVTALAASFNQVIDATDRFHWDVTLVDNPVPAVQRVEAGSGGGVSPRGQSREPPVESVPKTTVKARAINRPNTRTQDPVEALRPVHRQVLDRRVVAREQYPLQEVRHPDNREVMEVEQPSAVTETLTREPSNVVSAGRASMERSEERQQHEVKRSEIRDIVKTEPRSGMSSAETAAIVQSSALQRPSAITGSDAVQKYPEVRSSSDQQPSPSRVDDAGGDGRKETDPVIQPGADPGASADTVDDSRQGQVPRSVAAEASREGGPTRSASSIFGSGKGTGPDYGWLKRLLWESINRIKHYSDDAVENEWEGRVVMSVTVRGDGRIEEVRVTESSGNASLDREARELVARASPLVLDRALGADQVRLRVPISFGLE